jgi:carbonic anhydrase/acetyltransferase-like protein (isoleucine patch superfamily)
MTIRTFQDMTPNMHASVYIDETAVVIGDVTIGEDSSVWPMSVIRGDVNSINIGARTNIQDGCILHVSHDSDYAPGGFPLSVGDDVTVGHRVTLHACSVGNMCLVGMSATIMDGAVLGDNVIIGAGSLVPPGKQLESGYLYVGSPVKRMRELNEKELAFLKYSAKHYSALKDRHKNSC